MENSEDRMRRVVTVLFASVSHVFKRWLVRKGYTIPTQYICRIPGLHIYIVHSLIRQHLSNLSTLHTVAICIRFRYMLNWHNLNFAPFFNDAGLLFLM
jgi:hypothetical protein